MCLHDFIHYLFMVLQLSSVALERCEGVRQAFLCQIAQEPAWRLVFTDETTVNLLTTYHTMGRSPKGKCATVKSYFQRGDR